jgi:hypothetical protein
MRTILFFHGSTSYLKGGVPNGGRVACPQINASSALVKQGCGPIRGCDGDVGVCFTSVDGELSLANATLIRPLIHFTHCPDLVIRQTIIRLISQ